jgi:N-methylhydantoinase B
LLTARTDPITLEVLKNAILAVTDEMSAALQRSAFSTNIKTRGDFSCALFDADCRLVGQSFSQPTHLGSLVHSVPRAISEYGAERLSAGDAIVMNDAHRGAVHLNDVAMISPIDVDGTRVGYVANVAHHVDIGGSTPGSLGLNREIYQEGLILPPTKLVRQGELDPDLMRLVLTNIRSPRESTGDFRAQVAANELAVRGVRELCVKLGVAAYTSGMTDLLDYTERRVREDVKSFPKGTYSAVDYLDDDGFGDTPVRIEVAATIDESGISFDLTGCDDQGAGPMNATGSMAYSGIAFVAKALLDPDIPVNDGFYRTVRVTSRPGSVVNAVHPAAVAGGWEVCFRVAEAAFQALSPAFPDRIPAATKGIICNVAFGGIHPVTGYYAFYETIAGGYGAHSSQDGMDAVQPHIHNTENAPVEETELNYPVRIARFALIPDSGGAGTHRGGMGVRRDYWFVDHEATFSIISDRTRFAPPGLNGGHNGRTAHYILEPEGEARVLPSKSTTRLRPGQVISVQSPGGGGYGDARLRDPQLVAYDVRLGKVTREAALREYGVVVDEDGEIDAPATAAARTAEDVRS